MNREKLFGLISLCRKAGKLKIGFQPALDAAAGGEVALLLISGDLAENTRRKLGNKLSAMESPPRMIPIPFTMEELSRIAHRPAGICAVCDGSFAKGIEALTTDDEEDTI